MMPILLKNPSSSRVQLSSIQTSDGKNVADFFTIPLDTQKPPDMPTMGGSDWPRGKTRKHVGPGEEVMVALKFMPNGVPMKSTDFIISEKTIFGFSKSFRSGNGVSIGDDAFCS